ncbi:MAG: alpha/beta hydrolase [Bacteroidales bacterium]|nr:alpha/beta hydrolase [Bacteroidales bacterium]
MKSKTLLWTLTGIAAAVVLLLVGIKIFDGRSVKAIFVRQVLGFRVLNSAKYDFDKADMTDKSTIEMPDVKFPRPLREYRVGGMQVFEADAEDDSKPVLLYIHGGAYCHNFTKQHWQAMAKWADETGCGIVAPNYPLLPLHTATEAHPLMMRLYESLLERCDARRIVISGDSAGGGFSLALTQEIRDAELPVPAHLVLLAPWVDMMGGDASLQKYDNWLMVDTLPRFGRDWAEGLDIQDPKVSPLYGDMHGLPPTDFYAGTWDVLYTDVVKTYEKMEAEGVDVHLHVGEKMPHVYPILPCPEGEIARKEIAVILRTL